MLERLLETGILKVFRDDALQSMQSELQNANNLFDFLWRLDCLIDHVKKKESNELYSRLKGIRKSVGDRLGSNNKFYQAYLEMSNELDMYSILLLNKSTSKTELKGETIKYANYAYSLLKDYPSLDEAKSHYSPTFFPEMIDDGIKTKIKNIIFPLCKVLLNTATANNIQSQPVTSTLNKN